MAARFSVAVAVLISFARCGCDETVGPGSDASVPVPISLEFESSESTFDESIGVGSVAVVVRTDGRPAESDVTSLVRVEAASASVGVDFAPDEHPLLVPAGTADGERILLEVSIVDDLKVESSESFDLVLVDESEIGIGIGARARHTVTILDDDQVRLLGIGAYLTEVDLDTGSETLLGHVGIHGVTDVAALEYDPVREVVFAINDPGELWSIDLSTGRWNLVTYLGVADFNGMTIDDEGTLWAVARFQKRLYRLDLATGLGTPVGSPFENSIQEIAFDAASGTLYGFRSNQVFTIDRATAADTFIGTIVDASTGSPVRPVTGCDVDPTDGLAYCVNWDERAVAVDLASLTATVEGIVAAGSLNKLAVGPGEATLLAAEGSRLVTFDRTKAEVTADTAIGVRVRTLAGAGEANTFWATTETRHLVRMNMDSGTVDIGPRLDVSLYDLGYDAATDRLYGLSSRFISSDLVLVDPGSGTVMPVETPLSSSSSTSLRSLAIEPGTGALWVCDSENVIRIAGGQVTRLVRSRSYTSIAFDATGRLFGNTGDRFDEELHEVSTETGTGVAIGRLPFALIELASDPVSGTIIGFGGRPGAVTHTPVYFEIDLSSAQVTTIDGLSWLATGLAIDEVGGRIYTAAVGHLFSIDPRTGRARSLFDLGDLRVRSLALESETGLVWAIEGGLDPRVVTIDPTTGAVTIVGTASIFGAGGLAFSGDGMTLFGTSRGENSLFTVDKTTASVTLAENPLPDAIDTVRALTIDAQGRLMATDLVGRVVELDPITGLAAPVGQISQSFTGIDLQQ